MSLKAPIPPAMTVITNDIFSTYQIAVGIIRTISFVQGASSNKSEKPSLLLSPQTPQTSTRTRPMVIPKRNEVLQTIAFGVPSTSTTFPSRIIATPTLVDSQKAKGRPSVVEKESLILIEETGMTPLDNSSVMIDSSSKAVTASPKDKPARKRKSDAITESDQSSTIMVHTRTNPHLTSSSSTEKRKDISSDNDGIAAVLPLR